MEKAFIKNGLYIAFYFILLLFLSCHRNQDTIVGRWTVDKVNVDFYEDAATPEMVRQFGEIEKGNIMVISKDSVLTLIMDGDTLTGRLSMQDGGLLWNGEPFGKLEDGLIKTEALTPMGTVRTSYKKEDR